jgi:hypothetical protein
VPGNIVQRKVFRPKREKVRGEKHRTIKSSYIFLFIKHYYGDEFKEDEMMRHIVRMGKWHVHT